MTIGPSGRTYIQKPDLDRPLPHPMSRTLGWDPRPRYR